MLVATSTHWPTQPIEQALAAVRRRRGPDATRGLVPGLFAPDPDPSSIPVSDLVTGERLDELLDTAKQRWGAALPAAAALAWRSYTYWLAMPVVLGWAVARRVPLLAPEDVLVRLAVSHTRPLLTLGLRRCRLAVLPGDPIAGSSGVTIVTSESDLLERLCTALRDAHLDRLLAQLQTRVRLGTRTLLGSLASAVAYGVVRGIDVPAPTQAATADVLLSTLGIADLVRLEPGADSSATQLTVQRRTCCLAFTLPEPKLCSGCCIPEVR